ncbi:DP-EP family protein [Shewanella colwelliana]|uniref:DP-EP family protein n=1 Tax=Shewanella colwelliana TaxID=23 RepID=UPI0022AE59EB|nr:DP-EP family protein [Shewanella colwelliana]MCZ4337044.1 DP-EP family protein [Shewanella colwelliana]
MSSEKITVTVDVKEGPAGPVFSFDVNPVIVKTNVAKITYKINDEQDLGYLFAGAVFPKKDQSPASVLADISSFKVKAAGSLLVLKDVNVVNGTIGLKLLLADAAGNIYETQDPQVKNDPTD